ncbi:zinc finger 541 [Pelobates cultripes]|uniref:Zinc finger 541 n=1 Tax=Pelobates cultripes TaxID=61616 RepID=A0AAD1WJI9_PELCU|nr:zinc finger 541 [Pelobates cultripes]
MEYWYSQVWFDAALKRRLAFYGSNPTEKRVQTMRRELAEDLQKEAEWRNLVYPEYPELRPANITLTSTDNPLQDDLAGLSLSCNVLEDSSDSETLPSLFELGIFSPREDKPVTKSRDDAYHKRKSPQIPGTECGICGKCFHSTASLNKHYVTHSQKRSHVCRVCRKAFKRQDHLMGHMLTHLPNKPFKCPEHGCKKGYCDVRSLKRHSEICVFKKAKSKVGSTGPKKQGVSVSTTLSSQRKMESPGLLKLPIPAKDHFRFMVTNTTQKKRQYSTGLLDGQAPSHVPNISTLNENVAQHRTLSMPENVPSTSIFTLTGTDKDTTPTNIVLPSTADPMWLDNRPNETLASCLNTQHYKTQSTESLLVRSTETGHMGEPREDASARQSLAIRLNAIAPIYFCPPSKPFGNTSGWEYSDAASYCLSQSDNKTFQANEFLTEFSIHPYGSLNVQDQRQYPQRVLQLVTGTLQQHVSQNIPNMSVLQHFQRLLEPGPVSSQNPGIHLLGKTQTDSMPIKDLESASPRDPRQGNSPNFFSFPKGIAGDHGPGGYANHTKRSTGRSLGSTDSKRHQQLEPGWQAQVSSNKVRVDFDVVSAASPSQVALASFPVSRRFPSLSKRGSKVTSASSIQNIKLSEAEISLNMPKLPADTAAQCVSETSFKDGAGVLVIPVSVPVIPGNEQNKIQETVSDIHSEVTCSKKERKMRPGPKSLIIPPALPEVHPTLSGSFQSNLRSPKTYLSEHLHNGLCCYPPYTPPPMLSPVRQSTGLYFNTLCPPTPASTALGPNIADGASCDLCHVEDDTVFTIKPHINVGNRFQAEIPELRHFSLAAREEEKASLVWRPCSDLETDKSSRLNGTPDKSSRLNGTPDKSNRLNGTPDKSSRLNGTPDKSNRLNGTPDKSSRLNGTPDKSNHLNGTPDKSNPLNGTPDKSNRLNGTPDKSNPLNGTPDKSNRLNGTPDKSNHLNGTPDKSSRLNGTPDKSNRLNGTPDKSNRLNGTPDKIA